MHQWNLREVLGHIWHGLVSLSYWQLTEAAGLGLQGEQYDMRSMVKC